MVRWICLILLVQLLVFPSRPDGFAPNITWVDVAGTPLVAPPADPSSPTALPPAAAPHTLPQEAATITAHGGDALQTVTFLARRHARPLPHAPPVLMIST